MRDRSGWHEKLARQLRPAWPAAMTDYRPGQMLDTELGLYLLESINPERNAADAWTLLGGYPYGEAFGDVATDEQRQRIRRARHYLWDVRRRHEWRRSLEHYRTVPVELRGYELTDIDGLARQLTPSRAANRFEVYEELIDAAPPFAERAVPVATAGEYEFTVRDRRSSVVFPPELLTKMPTVQPHSLYQAAVGAGEPIEATWEQLEDAAREMDVAEVRSGNSPTWFRRLKRVRLLVRDDECDRYTRSTTLRIDRLLNMVGMVGAGKSTLRDILTYWAAKHAGRRVTLVVGDVAETLAITEQFTRLGITAAPVLGHSTRERNIERLHRRLATAGAESMLAHDHPGFAFLSSACPADALRGHHTRYALRIGEAPCHNLFPSDPPTEQDNGNAEAPRRKPKKPKRHTCPLWAGCPRHHGARALVDAQVWVATPASLVHSGVPVALHNEQIRYLELACRRSDLIIVDEADRVQMQLDSAFAPATTLVGRSPNSWLDEVTGHKINELARDGRIQLSQSDVDDWTNAVNTVSAAADRLYSLLISNPELRKWISEDYFSALTLHRLLIRDWFPEARTSEGISDGCADLDSLNRVNAVLDAFRDDPLRELTEPVDSDPETTSMVNKLVHLTLELFHAPRESTTRKRVKEILAELVGPDTVAGDELDQHTIRFEFTLVLAALHNRLDFMTILWPRVEAALNLENTSNVLSRRPPKDYEPIIPESPMGNILGFQFQPGDRNSDGDQSGELRFFRCNGVGRELLLTLPDIPASDNLPGPNVLLMSGTSWAGKSSRYHIHTDVGAILQPDQREVEAVLSTTFRTEFLYWPDTEQSEAIRLSGSPPERRRLALAQMLNQLALPDRGLIDSVSPLQAELDEIRYDDPDRARVLLLVGSYDEAKYAAEHLNSMTEWKGRVTQLISDDADLDDIWTPVVGSGTTNLLRRGEIATFRGEVLVAPLLAVERGHNIVLPTGKAAIGSVYFLARPHPRPDDISLAIQAINDWAIREIRGNSFRARATAAGTPDRAGVIFRSRAARQWHRFLTRRLAWSSLNDDEKEAFTWDQLVVIWQVIGRLVRGGVPARVVFVDAAFAPREAGFNAEDTAATSLLVSMQHVLEPYFDDESEMKPMDRSLVQALYEPLYRALQTRNRVLV
ncbi:signal recognition particle [Nocardia yunnanensis]|uniref:Signal recognition particle n=1 Tax=Nocardia yunnanensis TaxID=2382165 RepID=A0A386ZLN2_9NOCA|nr:signal recognition particle [Nocardia yunnanensis]AYF78527.1 signal recognition particle [Nocardia yunnanensis]